jgi:hypothetical protein
MICGGVPIGRNFFSVPNIHDLFEIFAASATVIAVCLAASELNNWKRQIPAEADNQLARRTVLALHRWKTHVARQWGWVEFASYQIDGDLSDTDQKLILQVDAGIDRDLDIEQRSREELAALLLECRLVWKADIEKHEQELLRISERCALCVKSYLAMSKSVTSPDLFEKRRHRLVAHWGWFKKQKLDTAEGFDEFISSLCKPLELELDERLFQR